MDICAFHASQVKGNVFDPTQVLIEKNFQVIKMLDGQGAGQEKGPVCVLMYGEPLPRHSDHPNFSI